MNIMNVLIPEVASGQNVQVAAPRNKGNVNSFQAFLSANQTLQAEDDVMNSLQAFIGHQDDNNDLTDLLASLLNGDFTQLGNLSLTEEEIIQLQNLLLDLENADVGIDPSILQLLSQYINNDWEEALKDQVVVDLDRNSAELTIPVHNEMIQLFGELTRIFTGSEEVSLKEQAGALLPLLRQWSQLKEQSSEEKANQLITEQLSEKDASIWKQLVNVYEKRNYFSESNMYRSDSAVTRNDVMNWLQLAFNHYETHAERIVAPMTTQHHMPMSEIQQYTIHVNTLDKVERVSEEVLNKFTNIIRESRFLTNNNMSQLSITLRPENLGNMIVRFTQIDGEMAVKIIVSSQAAKTMLESNIHQLKHMFSPHQVIIERDESISDDEFFSKEEKQEDEQDSLHEENNSRENKESEATEIDFNELFQQLSEEEITNE